MGLSPADERAVDEVVALLRPERSLLFITGAGLSADSGLPTYRGVGGLYSEGGLTRHGLPIEAVLSGEMMRAKPDVTWAYLREIALAARGATFNRGHEVIAEMEGHFARVMTLTQNVDGFHRLAGSRNVIDIHGDLHVLICTRCPYRAEVENADDLPPLPRCPSCGAVVRPDVVLFNEMLPDAKLGTLRDELRRGFDVVFAVGTSALFPYIVEPLELAHESGIPTVEINPGRSEVSDLIDIKIACNAAAALDAIWDRYRKTRPES